MSVPYLLLNHFFEASVELNVLLSPSNGCFLNGIEGARIPCCAIVFKCKHSILCTYLRELLHFILKNNFVVIIAFDVTLYHFVLNNIEGVMIPCLCTLYFNSNGICCAQTLGSFFILFRALFRSSHKIFI
jgi:hypothetical protein